MAALVKNLSTKKLVVATATVLAICLGLCIALFSNSANAVPGKEISFTNKGFTTTISFVAEKVTVAENTAKTVYSGDSIAFKDLIAKDGVKAKENKGKDEVYTYYAADDNGAPATSVVDKKDLAYTVYVKQNNKNGAVSATDAGSYTLTFEIWKAEEVKGKDAGKTTWVSRGSSEIKWAITTVDLSTLSIESIEKQTYTGSPITPAIVINYNKKALVKDTDFTVGYTDNKELGTASVTVTGIKNFTGTLQTSFDIIKETKHIIDGYHGTKHVQGSFYIDETRVLCDGTVKNVADLILADSVVAKNVTDNLTAFTYKYAASDVNGKPTGPGTEQQHVYTIYAANASQNVSSTIPGTYTASMKLWWKEGHAWHSELDAQAVTLNWSIYAKLDSTNTEITFGDSVIADGSEQTQEIDSVVFTYAEGKTLTLVEGVDYKITTGTNKSSVIGDHELKIEGIGNYTGTVTKEWTLYGAVDNNSTQIVLAGGAKIANGEEQTQAIEKVLFTVGDTPAYELVEGVDFMLIEGDKATDAGKYQIRIDGMGNYVGSATVAWIIMGDTEEDKDLKIEFVSDVMEGSQGAIESSLSDLAASILTQEELQRVANGEGLKIKLSVEEMTEVSDAIKAAIQEKSGSDTKAVYLNIKLTKQIGTDNPVEVHNAALSTFTIALPEGAINTNNKINRSYYILLNHNDEVSEIECTYDADKKTITFSTDKFSEYALGFIDEAVPEPAPQTSDATPIAIAVSIVAVALLGTAIARRKVAVK